VETIKDHFKGEPLEILQTFYAMLESHWKGTRALELSTVVSIVAVMLYVVSPVDAIPDVIPIIGFLDDAAVVMLAASQLSSALMHFREWQNNNNNYKKRRRLEEEKEEATEYDNNNYNDNYAKIRSPKRACMSARTSVPRNVSVFFFSCCD